jgi:predicted TPR repeat methyltransferase
VQHIPTHLAYDQWASVYDTDGNMLQAIDDLCLSTLLPSFLSTLSASKEISILDLGCGTGRNTSKLLSFAYPASTSVRITGVDFSAGMLNIARSKLTPLVSSSSTLSLRLECRDPFSSSSSSLPQQHAIISTLVLEHIPLATFFSTLSALLVPNGQALVTNMHADMGRSSQAGFVNADGIKVRGSSFVHTVEETIEAAQEAGLELVDVRERAMQRDDVEGGAVSERGRKWIGTKVWYAVVLSKIG